MKYATGTAFRTALERRLLNTAQQRGIALTRLRKLVVFERFLARLLTVEPDRWVLKGALALDYRFGTRVRSTRDMDLGRDDNKESVVAAFVAVQRVDLDDHFEFVVQPTTSLDKLTDVTAIRFKVRANLASRRFEDVIVDVGTGEALTTAPDILAGPELLTFAGLVPVSIPVIAIEQHIAEKVHAYTRTYPQGRQSTRAKDLVDLVLIQSLCSVRADVLIDALTQTYNRSTSQSVPSGLPHPPENWRVTYPTLANEVGIAPDLAAGHRIAADFLDPILSGTVGTGASWVPQERAWLRGD